MKHSSANDSAEQLQGFYERDYARGEVLTSIPRDGDFMYGQVMTQLRPYLRPELNVLDLGCNDGALSLYLASKSCSVLGIDLARSAVEIARRSAQRNGIEHVRFEALDFVQHWTKAEAFELVLCSHVLEHVPQELDFLRKIFLSLKPGGQLLLLCPASHSSLARVSRLLTGRFRHDEEVGHLRRYTRTSLEEVTRQAGFEVQRVTYLDGVLRDWFILCKPLRLFNKLWCRPLIRAVFNFLDRQSARLAFPATICVHARKGQARALSGHQP